MHQRHSIVLLLAIVLHAGCPASTTVTAASYEPRTTLRRPISDRCSDAACTCRPLDSNDGQSEDGIAAGHKRFEFRVPRSTSAIWVEVTGAGIYYKPPEQVGPACFYVDLPRGTHEVTLQSENRDVEVGLQTGLTVYEHGVKNGPNWYRSLDFVCGGLGRCTRAELKKWATMQRSLPRGVLDPCGSVMVRNVRFGGSRSERRDDEYQDLVVRFAMKIYDFETYQRPGTADCKAPIKNR